MNNIAMTYLKGGLFFSYFLLRGVAFDEIMGNGAGVIDFSIGSYLLAGGVVLFTIPALLQKDARIPNQFLYLFGVIFLITLSFFFWDNLNAGSASPSLYIEYVMSLSLIFFIYFTFQTRKEIEIFFKALFYSSLVISLFWILKAIQNPGALWRIGNILGEGANYPTVSYQLTAAAWAGPMTNFLNPNRSFNSKIFRDIPFLTIFTFGILLTGTRGGIIAELCLICILLFFYFKETNNKYASKSSFQILIIVTIPILVLGYLVYTLGGQLEAVTRIFSSSEYSNAFEARLQLWLFTNDEVFSNFKNLIFGSGFGSFNFFLIDGISTYPHNFFLDLSFNAGLPAALLLLAWIIRTWVLNLRYLRQKEQDHDIKDLTFKMIGWGFVACFNGMISAKFSSHTMIWIFLALSISLHQKILIKKSIA